MYSCVKSGILIRPIDEISTNSEPMIIKIPDRYINPASFLLLI